MNTRIYLTLIQKKYDSGRIRVKHVKTFGFINTKGVRVRFSTIGTYEVSLQHTSRGRLNCH